MRSKAETLIAAAVILGILHYAMIPIIVILISILLSFILDPIAVLLQKIRIPRSLAVFGAVSLFFTLLSGIAYVSFGQISSFMNDLPGYSDKIRGIASHVREGVENIQKKTEQALPVVDPQHKPVEVKPVTSWSDLFDPITKLSEIFLYASFVPFLVYFMLTWRDHAMNATVRLFKDPDRPAAHKSLQQIGVMLRKFLVGNLLVGLFIGTVSLIVFAILGLPHFLFIAYISGYLSLMPYLGVVLAMLPPLIVGLQHLQSGGFVAIVLTVVILHLFSLNVLYPKFLGRSMELNPFAAVIGLLLWGWMWGAMGLVLAVPIMAALKIVCDHVKPLKPYAVWLGVREAAPAANVVNKER